MLAVGNGKPQPLPLPRIHDHPGGICNIWGSNSGPSDTWVATEGTTWIPIAGLRHLEARSQASDPPHTAAMPRPLEAGQRLGPYRLMQRLGQGAQGEVWKALRREPETALVALKILRPGLSHNPARMAQFRREAERGVRLVGPSLLPVTEISTVDGHHFMAMPYVEGISLREVIRFRLDHLRDGSFEGPHRLVSLAPREYLQAMTRILATAARTLARVHDQRIAHRDIKPANILLDSQQPESVYLCDFGLGRDLEVATAEQMRDGAGTPMYMAPERLLRFTADEIKCDIYSMGVTLFEALTLQRPFQVPDHVSVQSLPAFLAASRPRRPGALQPGFPRPLEAVILQAMDRDPRRRHSSAGQLAADLDQIDVFAASGSRPRSFRHRHGPVGRDHRSGASRRPARMPSDGVAAEVPDLLAGLDSGPHGATTPG